MIKARDAYIHEQSITKASDNQLTIIIVALYIFCLLYNKLLFQDGMVVCIFCFFADDIYDYYLFEKFCN